MLQKRDRRNEWSRKQVTEAGLDAYDGTMCTIKGCSCGATVDVAIIFKNKHNHRISK